MAKGESCSGVFSFRLCRLVSAVNFNSLRPGVSQRDGESVFGGLKMASRRASHSLSRGWRQSRCLGQPFAITPEKPGSLDGEPWLMSVQLSHLGASVAGSGLTFGLRRQVGPAVGRTRRLFAVNRPWWLGRLASAF